MARLCDLNPSASRSELWWRLTGIAKEQLEHGGEWARLIDGQVVVLPADAVDIEETGETMPDGFRAAAQKGENL